MENSRFKFRAWDKKHNYMFDLDDKDFFINNNGLYVRHYVDYFGDEYENESEDFILMQFTGRKDKNGKEIYKGDIVRMKMCSQNMVDPPSVSHEVYEVKWSEEFASWMFDGEKELLSSCDMTDMEVIGNIHQHPHLLP